MKVAHFLPVSEANGPGLRSVIWFQGCTLACPGCVNPWSWARDGGQVLKPSEILDAVPDHVEGVTLTGGEPFQQDLHELEILIARAQSQRWSVVVFSGYTLEELQTRAPHIVHHIDILIAGRYDFRRKVKDVPLLGSENQQVHFLTDRYKPEDLQRVSPIEMHFNLNDGTVTKTGVH